MTRRFRSPTDPVERAGVPSRGPEGGSLARLAPLAWTAAAVLPEVDGAASAPETAPTHHGGTPRTQRNRGIALAGYPQRICGQLVGLWITQGQGADRVGRTAPDGAGRGERG